MAVRVRRSVLREDRDAQVGKVYDWGANFFRLNTGSPMTPGRLHKLVRDISKLYGIKKPRLEFRKMKSNWWAYATGNSIVFNNKTASWTPFVVAHEMAHIVQQQYGMYPRYQWHGAQFAGILAYILHKTRIMPVQATLPSMAYAGIKYVHPHWVRPAGLKAIRKKNRRRAV